MNRKNFRNSRALNVALILAGLVWTGLAWANGRDFSGFYRTSDVSVSGETASLTLTVQIFNRSGADVSNATVLLSDWIIPGRNYGSFRMSTLLTGVTCDSAARSKSRSANTRAGSKVDRQI